MPGRRATRAGASRAARLEFLLGRYRRAFLVSVLLAAAALRLASFAAVMTGPFADQHKWVNSDMSFFDGWARAVLGGDVLSARVGHPYHGWHRAAADLYFESHPEMRGAWAKRGAARGWDAGQALWDAWYGGARFHQEPLYAYLVAATYAVTDGGVWLVFLLQSLAGIACVLLVHLLARRYFGDGPAAIAALLAAFYGPLVFLESTLLRETWIVLATLGCLQLAEHVAAPTRMWWLFLAGVAWGMAIVLKSTFAPFVAVAIVAVAVRRGRPWIRLWPVAAGLALALAPAVARNIALGVDALGLSSVGPVTFINSNTNYFRPEMGIAFDVGAVARILPVTLDSFWGAARMSIATHASLAAYAALLCAKLASVFHWFEQPDNANFYFYREHLLGLRVAGVSFVVVAPLALLGALRAARSWRVTALLWAAVLVALGPLVVFYSSGRLRLPLVVLLLVLAGEGFWSLVRDVYSRRWLALGARLAFLAAAALFVARPIPAGTPIVRFADLLQPYNTHFRAQIDASRAAGDAAGAAPLWDEVFSYAPSFVRAAATCYATDHPEAGWIATWYADLAHQRAQLLDSIGRSADASRVRLQEQALRRPCGSSTGPR